MADPGATRQPFRVPFQSTPAPQPPPSAPMTTAAAPGPARTAPHPSTTSGPTPTPAPVPAPSADAGTGSNMNASSSLAPPVIEDFERKALAINLLKRDYRPERLEFQFVKSRPLGVIVEDLNDVTMVVDFKLEEDGT